MDVQKLFSDYSVMTASEGDKHHRDGWINVSCPFCSGDPGFHLGFNINESYAVCWRCGHKNMQKALSSLLGISYKKSLELIKQYKGISHTPKTKIKAQKKAFKLPNKLKPIQSESISFDYLRSRGFSTNDIKKLEDDFSIKQTGPICNFSMNNKPVNLKFRIIAPIYYQGNIVSWQSRDMSGNSNLKYITCPGESEKINHKKLIYVHKRITYNSMPKYIILTEGIFDVWKIHLGGFFSGCGFGVDLTIDQIYFLRTNFKRVYFFLDPDRAGDKKTKELFSQLYFAGVNCSLVSNPTKKDPGDMRVKEIINCLKGLI